MATINGTKKSETLKGTKKADKIRGYGGNDKLYGEDGNDSLSGDAGNDRLYGRSGRDVLNGGPGNDFLRGDKHGDRYLFGTNFGFDTVEDDDDSSGANGGDVIHFAKDNFRDLRSVKVIKEGKDDLQIRTKNGTVNIKDFRTRKDRIELFQFKDSLALWDGKKLVRGSDFAITTLNKAAAGTKNASHRKNINKAISNIKNKRSFFDSRFKSTGVFSVSLVNGSLSFSNRDFDRDIDEYLKGPKNTDITIGGKLDFSTGKAEATIFGATFSAIGSFINNAKKKVRDFFRSTPLGRAIADTADKVSRAIAGFFGDFFGNNDDGDDDDDGVVDHRDPEGRPLPSPPRPWPVILDLDRDGSLDLVSDTEGGWTGPSDGFLAIDADGSGAIDQANEIAFVEWDEKARTDLEGLALAFDSNSDGVFDAQDERFTEFSVWQDANGDRVSQADELRSLEEAGITSIDLSGVPYDGEPAVIQEKAGNQVFGVTTVAYDDGSFGIAGDVALAVAEEADGDVLIGDGADDALGGYGYDVPDAEASGSSDAVERLGAEVAALTSKVDQLVSDMASFGAEPVGCCGCSHPMRQRQYFSDVYAANTQAA